MEEGEEEDEVSEQGDRKRQRGGGTLEAEEESAGPRWGARAEGEENGEQNDREGREEGKRRRERRKTKEVSKETERGIGVRATGTCRA